MPYRIYLLLARLEWIQMVLQACPNNTLVYFLRRVSCLLNQTRMTSILGGIIGIMKEISRVIRSMTAEQHISTFNVNMSENGILAKFPGEFEERR